MFFNIQKHFTFEKQQKTFFYKLKSIRKTWINVQRSFVYLHVFYQLLYLIFNLRDKNVD